MMTSKYVKRKQPLKKFIFQGSKDAILSEMSTEKVWQVLCALLPVYIYVEKDMQIAGLICTLFRDRDVAVSLLKGDRCLQLVGEMNQKSSFSSFRNIPVQTSFSLSFSDFL